MDLIVRNLGLQDYAPTWRAMQAFTRQRGAASIDEFWCLQHHAVYTLGQAGRREHILGDTGSIPVIDVDRGGQVTYHGPGQLIVYTLLDLRRRNLGVRRLVTGLERAVIALLGGFGIAAETRPGAPGVYVDARKIAALGLRVTRGCCYHGLSFNAAMDLAPFALIDPCGYRDLEVTQLSELGVSLTPEALGARLVDELTAQLGYNAYRVTGELPETWRIHA